jgi:uncharacterized protein
VREALLSMGFRRIAMANASAVLDKEDPEPSSDCVVCGSKEAFLDEMLEFEREIEDALRSIKARKPTYSKRVMMHLELLVTARKKKYFCGAGLGLAALSSDGEFFVCHRFVGDDRFRMGRLSETDRIVESGFVRQVGISHPKCVACWARHFCGGGCLHEGFQWERGIYEPSEQHCVQIKHCIELTIGLYARLDNEDREFVKQKFRAGLMHEGTDPKPLQEPTR